MTQNTDMLAPAPALAHLPDSHPQLSKARYTPQLRDLQLQLLRLQQAYRHAGKRAVIVLEGFDAAGKGGVIKRLVERLDPRSVRVHAIAAPTAAEQGQHHLQRFWSRLPRAGRISIFDRSWYGRVLVERVEKLTPVLRWQQAYDEILDFERALVQDGIRLVKIFLAISREEQRQRFLERLDNPFKRWKLTPEDLRNRQRWPAYEVAIDAMFARTHHSAAPWALIAANHKWYGRVAALRHCVTQLSPGVDPAGAQPIDARFAATLRRALDAADD